MFAIAIAFVSATRSTQPKAQLRPGSIQAQTLDLFPTAAGGLVHDRYVGQDFQLDRGWNRRRGLHGRIETNILDWFDAVERYELEIRGLFYRC